MAEQLLSVAEQAIKQGLDASFEITMAARLGDIELSPDLQRQFTGRIQQLATTKPNRGDENYEPSLGASRLWVASSIGALGSARGVRLGSPKLWVDVVQTMADVPRMSADPSRYDRQAVAEKKEGIEEYAHGIWAIRSDLGRLTVEDELVLAEEYLPVWYRIGSPREETGLISKMSGAVLCQACAIEFRSGVESVFDELPALRAV